MAPIITKPATELESATSLRRPYFRSALLSLLLVSATVALYYKVRTHPWSELDDRLYVVDNVNLHELNWKTVWWSFTALNYANWIPLSWLSHAVDYHFFGDDPAGHHLVSVAFQALNVVLVFWVLRRATGYTARSFMVAALFAVHPLNVEAVVWIAERKTLLSMVFFLLTLGAYHWYARDPKLSRYNLVFVLFAMGLAAKSQVITLPCVLLLWDYWPLQRMETPWREAAGNPPYTIFSRKTIPWLIKEKVPLLLLGAYDAMLTVFSQKSVRVGLMPPLSLRLKNAIFSYWLYLKKAFWPSGMAPELPQMGRFVSFWQIAGILLLLIAISGLVIAARRHRYLPVGWFWFLGTLVPMVGLLQPSQQGSADRFVYQAYLGLFVMVCWGLSDAAKQHSVSPAWLAAISVVVLLALASVANRQIDYWKNECSLWAHAAQVNNYHWLAQDNLGACLVRQGNRPEAMQHFFLAESINPDDGVSKMEISFDDLTAGKIQEAITVGSQALLDHNLHDNQRKLIWEVMGTAYRKLGDVSMANECFRQAAQLRNQ